MIFEAQGTFQNVENSLSMSIRVYGLLTRRV